MESILVVAAVIQLPIYFVEHLICLHEVLIYPTPSPPPPGILPPPPCRMFSSTLGLQCTARINLLCVHRGVLVAYSATSFIEQRLEHVCSHQHEILC